MVRSVEFYLSLIGILDFDGCPDAFLMRSDELKLGHPFFGSTISPCVFEMLPAESCVSFEKLSFLLHFLESGCPIIASNYWSSCFYLRTRGSSLAKQQAWIDVSSYCLDVGCPFYSVWKLWAGAGINWVTGCNLPETRALAAYRYEWPYAK
jgi:hypothetical protein